MNSQLLLIGTIICLKIAFIDSFIPIAAGVIAGGASIYGIYQQYVKCSYQECCDDNWHWKNMTVLNTALDTQLFGQHLVKSAVMSAVKGHISNPNPRKPLVLSFHGWTGVGKNYVSRMIAESLFRQGMESEHVHLYLSPLHFPHQDHIDTYKSELQRWISGNVSLCDRSLFIFDEIDKMPPGLLDSIAPYMDGHKVIDGVRYLKTTFILLSNIAGNAITREAYIHWEDGYEREDISMKTMEEIIINTSYNTDGGLRHSELIRKNVISALVPFLPLEVTHVKECIRQDIANKRPDLLNLEEFVNEVANELQYFPSEQNLYSVSGCKRVTEKVDYVLERKGLL